MTAAVYVACGCSHGYIRYSHGCRCDICRTAKRDYVKARRRAGLEPNVVGEIKPPAWNQKTVRGGSRVGLSRFVHPTAKHGTSGGYRKGCRCWPCTDAYAERRRPKSTA